MIRIQYTKIITLCQNKKTRLEAMSLTGPFEG